MKLFRFNQIGQELLGKRMVYVTINTADAAAPDESKKAPTYNPELGESEIHKAATRLKVGDILSASGEKQSSKEIATRIKDIRDLRREGKFDELKRMMLGWYGNHTQYGAEVRRWGANITAANINTIRNREMRALRTQLAEEARLEFDQITAQNTPPQFTAALAHLSGGGGAVNRLGAETQGILNQIQLNAPNSATEYLRLTHLREEQQNLLDIAKSEVNQAKGILEGHKTELNLFKEEVPRFSKKIMKWMKYGALASIPLGLLTGGGAAGVGAMFGAEALTKIAGIGALVPLGLTGAGGILTKIGQKLNDAWRAGRHWLTSFGHKRAIEQQEESTVVRERRRILLSTEEQLKGLRVENAGKLAVLQRQYSDYNQAKIDATTEAERDQIDQRMQSLASVMTLYRVSEGNYARRITAPGPVTNEFIVQQLRALGVTGIEDDTDAEEALVQLAQKDDEQHVIRHQTTLQTIGLGDDIMKEVHTLDNAEETRLRNFLNNPNQPVAPLLAADFRRKAVRMVAVVDAIHALPDNNAWRESFRLAILKELDGQVGDIARASAMSIFKNMESSKDPSIKKTATRLKRDPLILWNHGGITARVNRPRNGEDFQTWTSRLSPATMQQVLTVLDRVKSYSIDNTGNLVDRLTPLRAAAETALNAFTDTDFIIQLNDNPKSLMSAAALEYKSSKGEFPNFPDSPDLSFLEVIEQYEDPKELSEIRSLLQKLLTERAFVREGSIHFLSEDVKQIDENLGKIEDKNIIQLIKAQPDVMRAVDGALPTAASLTPPARNFNEYKRRLSPDDRLLLANALLSIQNPATKHVLSADRQGLEREVASNVNDVMKLLEKMEEKNSKLAFCIEGTPDALMDYARAQRILAPGTVPRGGQDFNAWVRGLNDADIRRVRNLLNQVKNCEVNRANEIVNPLQPLYDAIDTELTAAFRDTDMLDRLNTEATQILTKAASDRKSSSKNFDIPSANDFAASTKSIEDKGQLRSILSLLPHIRREAFIREGEVHFLSEDIKQIDENLKKISDKDVVRLIERSPDALGVLPGALPDAASVSATNFNQYKRLLGPDDRLLLINALLTIQNPATKYVLNAARNGLEREASANVSDVMKLLEGMEEKHPHVSLLIHGNASVLTEYAKTANFPWPTKNAPGTNETFTSWVTKLKDNELRQVKNLLHQAQYCEVSSNGDSLVNRLRPLHNAIESQLKVSSFNDGAVLRLLDTESVRILNAASDDLGRKEVKFDIPHAADFKSAIRNITKRSQLQDLLIVLPHVRKEAFIRDGEVHFLSEDIKQIDENLSKIDDKRIIHLIKSQPDCLQSIDPNLPLSKDLNPKARNFDDYIRRLSPKNRLELIDALLKIQNPATKYVMNENNDSLVSEAPVHTKKLLDEFAEFLQKDKKGVASLIQRLPQTLLDFAEKQGLAIPDKANNPKNNQYFESWVKNLDSDESKIVTALLLHVRHLKVENNILVDPLESTQEKITEIVEDTKGEFRDKKLLALFTKEPEKVLGQVAPFYGFDSKDFVLPISSSSENFVDRMKEITNSKKLTNLRYLLGMMKLDAYLHDDDEIRSVDNDQKEIKKLLQNLDEDERELIRNTPQCLNSIEVTVGNEKMRLSIKEGVNFQEFTKNLSDEDRVILIRFLSHIKSPYEYVKDPDAKTELIPESLRTLRLFFSDSPKWLKDNLNKPYKDLEAFIKQQCSKIGYNDPIKFEDLFSDKVEGFLNQINTLKNQPQKLEVILNILTAIKKSQNNRGPRNNNGGGGRNRGGRNQGSGRSRGGGNQGGGKAKGKGSKGGGGGSPKGGGGAKGGGDTKSP